MSTEKHQIIVSDLVVDVVRKDIKNLHLAVYPPAGRVRVAAPLQVNDEAVRLFTISRLAWIKRQQAKFESQERHHNDRFIGYMNSFMPLWQYYREELNRAPLGHESWE